MPVLLSRSSFLSSPLSVSFSLFRSKIAEVSFEISASTQLISLSLPLSLSLFHRTVSRRTLLANQIGPGPRSLAPTARIFRLLIVDRLLAIDHGNTRKTRGNSVIGRQPSTVDLPFLLFLFLSSLSPPRPSSVFSTLDVFCVRKYFDKYLRFCSPKIASKDALELLWRRNS